MVNAKPRLQTRHMDKAKSVGKIPILTWCIFGVLQFTSLHSIDCITSLDIKSQNHTMSMTSQDNSELDFRKHGGLIEKSWRNFCKESPFGFHLE